MNAKLKAGLTQSGMRQYEVARLAGLTENDLSRIVQGRRDATPEERMRIATALGRAEGELFEGASVRFTGRGPNGSPPSASESAAERSCGTLLADDPAARNTSRRGAPSARS